MSPLAGSATARGIFKTKSGLGIVQLSTQRRGCGVSVASPAGDFVSTHSASASISTGLNDGSLENFTTLGTANHGGLDFGSIARRISLAEGLFTLTVANVRWCM